MKFNALPPMPTEFTLCAFVCITLLGCGDSAESTSPPTPETVVPEWESEVQTVLPDVSTGTTYEVRAHGTCNLQKHDSKNPFEFELEGKLSYRIRIKLDKFVKDRWHINPLADVTNSTGSLMYLHYYAAFFNDGGRLVGCCAQGLDVESADRPMQLASLVIAGSKERLSTATRFKIVIYESEKRIGTEPISAEAAANMVGREGKVITKLEQTDSSNVPHSDLAELRLLATVSPEDAAPKQRNTHLKIQGTGEYDIYLSNARTSRSIQKSDGDGNVTATETFETWETDFEFDRVKRIKGVNPVAYAALIDKSGQLIACAGKGAPSSIGWMFAPEDKLLSAAQLDVVVYETVAAAK